MKGCNTWSYRPYRPFFWKVGDIYICRVVPYEHAIHLEWLQEERSSEANCQCEDVSQCEKYCECENSCKYEILYRKRGEETFVSAGVTFLACEKEYGEYTIENLEAGIDYEILVQSGAKKSRIRLAHTGKSIDTVVNYLHPDDDAYAYSGKYLCSPSIVRHPGGYLLASMDLHAGAAPQNLTLIYRSDDNGATWHYVSELMPCFWGKMFIHNGELYMLSCSTEYGDLLIGKSVDGGKTFSAPVPLFRGSNGKKGNSGVHKNPQNPEVADLPIPTMTIEGTLAVSPEGKLLNIMRFGKRGHAIAYEVNTVDYEAQLTYSHLINFPANFSKFMIKYDDVSGKYYSVVTRLHEGCDNSARNYLTLMASEDLTNWYDVCALHDYRHCDWHEVGFQYVDFEIEGEDIIYLCRTAINGAHNFHDSNYSTFHRIEDFRTL